MSHADDVLASIANAQFRKRVADQLSQPYPLLGMVYIPAGNVDKALGTSIESPVSYRALRSGPLVPEVVCSFALSDALGLPPLLKARAKAAQPEYIDTYLKSLDACDMHIQNLRDAGCSTAGGLVHEQPFAKDTPRIMQICLFVPLVRTLLDDTGRVASEPNTDDQVAFVSYLAKNNFLSLTADRKLIVSATNARVMELLAPTAKKARATKPQRP
jgi:hypothetical protein